MKPFLAMIVIMCLNSWGQTLNYYPLEVGNHWQYFKTYKSSLLGGILYEYRLVDIIITADTFVNNKKYCSTAPDFWIRFDTTENKIFRLIGDSEYVYMDFNLPAGTTFQQIVSSGSYREVSVDIKDLSFLDTTLQVVGFKHMHDFPYPPFWISDACHFYNGLGMVNFENAHYRGIQGSVSVANRVICIKLIDSTGNTYYNHNSQPIFRTPQNVIITGDSTRIRVTINHKYTILSTSFGNTRISGCSYIDSLIPLLYFSNSIDLIPVSSYNVERPNMQDFEVTFSKNRWLYSQGYNKIVYKFTAKDKSIIPVYKTYPDTGYGTIQILLSNNPDTAYYPLHVNNEWVYQKLRITNTGNYIHDSYVKTRILKDTLLSNNKTYKKISYFDGNIYYERMDPFFANTYRAVIENGTTKDIILDSISARLNNEYISYRLFPDTNVVVLSYGNSRKIGLIGNPQSYWTLTKDKGLTYLQTYKDTSGGYSGTIYQLSAARINGVIIGDTTLLNIRETTEPPQSYALYQNFPNPFNPVTTIKFSIPTSPPTPLLSKERGRGEVVTLKAFDILGREVATLVNEEKEPGYYEVVFDVSELSSGVYIYRLTTKDFTASRKMLVVK